MRVLLCLLSKQHVPNLLSVHHYKPDQLVLVASRAMSDGHIDQYFLKALKLGGLDYDARHRVEPVAAEYDLAAIRNALEAAVKQFPADAEWIVNLTGGTKPMSIAAYEFFKDRDGSKLIYTHATRPGRFLDMRGGPTEDETTHRLSIKEFLAGYGFELTKPEPRLAEAEERARAWAPSARLLARRAGETDVLDLNDEERDLARRKGIKLDASRFNLPCDELRDEWLAASKTVELDRHQAEFLTGGWLEVFFWDLLSRRAGALGIWDVRLGLIVRSREGGVANELDVAFMHNHGLSVIECKTGFQDNRDVADALYKVEAVVGQFGAGLVRSHLATTGANVLNERGELKEHLRERAAIYNCQILTRDQIRELAGDGAEAARRLFIRRRPPRGRAEA